MQPRFSSRQGHTSMTEGTVEANPVGVSIRSTTLKFALAPTLHHEPTLVLANGARSNQDSCKLALLTPPTP